ncbi:MAG TPA: class I tRNA ligase family protein [Candidatus Pacearchaeota archaeon]|nr:class I tRNA ligase family protein [Candidatus Pacearchaeota archaeon]
MNFDFAKNEEKILDFWSNKKVFEKSLAKNKKGKNFVFFEGPPTANGRPGIHHLLARVYKDVVCRYRTMQGFNVQRKSGWDTHGLPVEIEVEKKLGFTDKKQIEEYGIAKFNKMCQQSVWEYKQEWEKFTKRIGYWLDLENPYITYNTSYIESVWWILKQLKEKDLLYKGYRVAPYCARCGTSLSSHELAQGYTTVKDPSVFVKFKIKSSNQDFSNSYFLVWTTTPWTLPGNVLIALNKNLQYCKIQIEGSDEFLILGKDRLSILEKQSFKVLKEYSGQDLIGLEYEAPFPTAEKFKTENTVYYFTVHAKFVCADDGTGFVHIAPAFGEDDKNLVDELNRKSPSKVIPIVLTVDKQGNISYREIPGFGKFVKEADKDIIKDLQERNLLFKTELYEHEYPFCWRCKSPLLYYAQDSWFIATTKKQKEIIANNEKINWIPGHIKNGRFGTWLKELKDWNLSRNRFWGTPLPVWECSCGHREVVGSISDLMDKKYSNNEYYFLRHGHYPGMDENINVNKPDEIDEQKYGLSQKGRDQVSIIIKKFNRKIDLIVTSDLARTVETAKISAQILGIDEEKIIVDKRLREFDSGIFNYRNPKEKWEWFNNQKDSLNQKYENGESFVDFLKRLKDFCNDLNKKYNGKNILIVSHQLTIFAIEEMQKGHGLKEIVGTSNDFSHDKYYKINALKLGQIKKINIKDLPFNDQGEIDLHRPYVDESQFYCPKCKKEKMQRTPEVIDCWFDSGSMPFAQYHYPFENKKIIDSKLQYPADYISEAVDQTRGWFYTLLTISTLLGKGTSYKNVISLGHILDEKGEKMSKSKGNIINPWEMCDKYGADAIRWYFYTMNQPGEPKLFSEKDLSGVLRKINMTFLNCFVFFDTYRIKKVNPNKIPKPKILLDRWIISQLNSLILEMSKNLDSYDINQSARSFEKFLLDDFSLWYVRRSRKRFQQPENAQELNESANIFSYILITLCKLSAPFMPFLAEEIYQRVIDDKNKSVHLEKWPEADKKLIDKKLSSQMQKTREIITQALAQRAKAQIKVRQPLAELFIADSAIAKNKDLCELIKEELNVKKISFGKSLELDLHITPELKKEGIIREIIRNIQESRKESNLSPKDKIVVFYEIQGDDLMQEFKEYLLKEGKINKIINGRSEKSLISKEIEIDNKKIFLSIQKI